MQRLTTETVQTLISKPCVLAARSNPNSPNSVIDFWFGIDSKDVEQVKSLDSSNSERSKLWWATYAEFDSACKDFIPVIRGVGLRDDKVWDSSLFGKFAQILLADQLARNAFRGEAESYKYESIGVKNALALIDDVKVFTLPDSFLNFVGLPLMHSEEITLHDRLVAFHDERVKRSPGSDVVKFQTDFIHDHRDVIVRFGRYPHRNKALGRKTTGEEKEWLSSPDLPGWAKV